VGELDQDAGLVQVLRFSPDGSLIAGGHVGLFTLWDGSSPRPQMVFPAIRETHAAAFSRDGRLLAGGGQEQVIDVWELSSGSRVARFEGSNSTVRSLVFGPEDRTVFSACWYTVDRWDLASGERVWSVPSSDSLWGIAVDPTGRLLTASLNSGELRRWEVDREEGMHRMPGRAERTSAVFGPDGSTVFVGDDQGLIQLADLVTLDVRSTFDGHESEIWSLDVSSDGTRVASASADGAVRVRDAGSGALIWAVDDGQIQTGRAIDLDEAGHHLGYAAIGGRFKVRDLADQSEIEIVPPTQAESLAIVFSPDGQSLATTSRDGNVRFWSLEGEPLGAVPVDGPWTMAYSPDGDLLALGLWDRSIRILNTADLSMSAELEGHGGTVWATAFKPDDPRILASAAADGTVRLWDITNQLNVATIPVEPNRDVHTVSFTADGTTLLAAGEFGSVVWHDLTHFDRHIAGNLEYHIERFGSVLDDEQLHALRAWAAGIMERPWPRFRPRVLDAPN
jgi:WD40 repeat protein